jgi:hypothetical protein
LAFVSSVLFFWPLYRQYFSFGLCIIWNKKDKRKGQMIQSTKEKDRGSKGQKKRTDDTKVKGKGQMIQRPK